MKPPLDEPVGFTPAEDERPAGLWMAGYWKEIARWSGWFGYGVVLYTALIVFWYASLAYRVYDEGQTENVIVYLVSLIFYLPIGFLAYFCLKFSRTLSFALKTADQLTLEKAFLYLRRALLSGLVVAGCWIVLSVNVWRVFLNLFLLNQMDNSGDNLLSE